MRRIQTHGGLKAAPLPPAADNDDDATIIAKSSRVGVALRRVARQPTSFQLRGSIESVC